MLNLKIPDTKHLRNLGHYEKTKPKNNKNTGEEFQLRG